MRVRILLLTPALISLANADLRSDLEPLLEQHCYDCHDDFDPEAGLNLLDLKFDPSDKANREAWEKVFHRIETGEMPPKKKKRPDAGMQTEFLKTLNPPLRAADLKDLATNGRVHSRRLTAEEYEYSLHDLLGIDIPLAQYLTAETSDGFESTAAHQQISHFHLDNYLRTADKALEEAFDRVLTYEKAFIKDLSAKQLLPKGRGNYRGPEYRNGKAITWSLGLQFTGRITPTNVPENGWYRITIKNAAAINPGPDQVVWGTLQTGSGFASEPLLFPAGIVEATPKPRDFTFDTWILKDHILIFTPDEPKKHRGPAEGGNLVFGKMDLEKQGAAGISFDGVKIERLYPNATRWEVRQSLFPGLDPKLTTTGGPDPKATLTGLIKNFASRAFRRPVTDAEVIPYQQRAFTALDRGKTFPASLRDAYHALLCSPKFLTFVEKPGALDDHAIASRLSYLLWKSLPDLQLRKLANQGSLRDPKIFHNQIDRLLADPKSKRFLTSFTNQWLDLRNINFTQPDPKRFSAYDLTLEQSLLAETRAFINELITQDLPISNLIKSDFTFLNTRLQRHYGLDDLPVKPGQGLQKIPIESFRRSGLLMQGAILKVTADGSVTSPVIRGIWINEHILGVEIPPPPPGIPAIEPDIRGAISIRDQLAKHSKSVTCARCHDKIDPSGFALESFDPIGQFRLAYGRQKNAAKVDPSGITPDGVPFKAFNGWREIYFNRPKVLAEAFANQILKYGTGGEIRFSDTPQLEKILAQSSQQKFGVKSILHAALASDIFLTK
ncbi:MAG: DUF1592 domain-containing protein [Akkermansiaceae bacterium]|jgi:hypothetical protein